MRFTMACLVLVACSGKSEKATPLVDEAKRCAAKGAEMSCGRPIVRVANLRAAQAYYRDKLGFTVEWDHGDPPDFGAVKRGDFELFMCERCQSGPGMWSMTFMHDVDPYYAELQKRGAHIVMAPKDMPWGLREMHVGDLDGNVIRFGSHGD